ncbi:MAG: SIS domain-containing protein [Deltaproteobacteria bacterium]|nr:SIS domain-containing protein [Deltaproteobacteria bacterium]
MNTRLFLDQVSEHIDCFQALRQMAPEILRAARELTATIESGKKILICGNGGSAADAQHFAAELVGRFEKERASYPALALTTDSSALTAIGNDYGFDRVFSRQVEGLGQKGDTLVVISTSGNSPNICEAVRKAVLMGMQTIGLLGRDGGCLKDEVGCPVIVPHARTARIQEVHGFILHFWACCVDEAAKAPAA